MFRGRQMVRTARQVRSDGPPPSRDEVIAAQEQSVEEPQTAERISFASAVRPVWTGTTQCPTPCRPRLRTKTQPQNQNPLSNPPLWLPVSKGSTSQPL